MKRQLAAAIAISALGGLSALALPCAAQTPSAPPAAQNPAQSSAGGPAFSSTPTLVVPGTPSPGTTPGLTPGTGAIPTISPSSGPALSFGRPPVGRGYPGMPGGPPLNAPMGAGNPSGSYMTPPVIGPLVCGDLSAACQ